MVGTVTTVAIAVVIGAVVGVLAGMLGVGGGSMLLPVFRLVFGLSAVSTTATSLFTIIPTSVSGAASHLRNRTCVPKLGVAMGVGGALTSSLGVQLAQVSPSWLIMTTAAVVIGYSAFTMFRKALAAPKIPRRSSTASVGAGESATPKTPADLPTPPDLQGKHLVIGVLIGGIAGVISGYIGLGGGFIMVPLMVSFLHMSMKLTSGTSLIAIMILAIPATVTQCLLGNVDYLVGIAIACGSVPGALFGATLTQHLPERTLRFAFSGLLVFGAVMLIVKELGVL